MMKLLLLCCKHFSVLKQGLKRALWWKNAKMVAMLVTLVLGLCLLVLFSKCGISLEKCRSGA